MAEPVELEAVRTYFQRLQQHCCEQFARVDARGTFMQDDWQHQHGGGGRTCIMQNGRVFEKGGVNYSYITGDSLPAAALARHPLTTDSTDASDPTHPKAQAFVATGLSLVMHPHNPFAPTCHMNVRFFMLPGAARWWFGGGYDLTPTYGFVEDCVHWHRTARAACQPFGRALYRQFKQQCDRYFVLPHRHETRGIGGIFFDDYTRGDFTRAFAFARSIGDSLLDGYLPIIDRRHAQPYTAAQRQFQCYRRGRYVEFNLLYDRGTLFGLQSGGRSESILMSLPPKVAWHYNWQPEPNSPEAQLTEFYLQPRDWLNGDARAG